jgi:hypothetical protein
MQDLRGLTIAILCVLLAILQDARGQVVTIATWNLEWFPGGKPNSSQSERLVHMSAAKDALIDIRPDILCLRFRARYGRRDRWQWIRSSTDRSRWQRLDLPGP